MAILSLLASQPGRGRQGSIARNPKAWRVHERRPALARCCQASAGRSDRLFCGMRRLGKLPVVPAAFLSDACNGLASNENRHYNTSGHSLSKNKSSSDTQFQFGMILKQQYDIFAKRYGLRKKSYIHILQGFSVSVILVSAKTPSRAPDYFPYY
ncbi:hypothetical protein NKH19_12185 [Mesorhizobium sp. M1338]|uniref:hypothetical protein n=1 Tax=unclassified Mesorhizobium TaxID=325217 RepID=UPI003338CD61